MKLPFGMFRKRGLMAVAGIMIAFGVIGLLAANPLFGEVDRRPILVLAEGQSNMSNLLPYDWRPQPNLYLWNHFNVQDTGGTGTGFIAMPDAMMNASYAFANEIALANPQVNVYVVNESYPAIDISHWLPGAKSPDMYAATSRNIVPALALIGQPVWLVHYWWQGESDLFEGNADYPADFRAHRARKATEKWYPHNTPIIVMGMSPHKSPDLENFSHQVGNALSDDENIFFVDIGGFPENLFDPVGDRIHLTAKGYEQAGKMAYSEWQARVGAWSIRWPSSFFR